LLARTAVDARAPPTDADGAVYVDFVNNFASLIHGHAHPAPSGADGRCFDHRSGKPLMPASGTFTANRVTMTAGLASMQLLTSEAYAAPTRLGDRARRAAADAIAATGYPAQITGAGSIFHLHMHERPIHDYRSAYAAPAEVRALRQLQQRMLRRGCLISPAGSGFISTVTPRAVIDGFPAALFDVLAAMERPGSA
jgi:glutamate-1-semialdehyde aminotransferase